MTRGDVAHELTRIATSADRQSSFWHGRHLRDQAALVRADGTGLVTLGVVQTLERYARSLAAADPSGQTNDGLPAMYKAAHKLVADFVRQSAKGAA